MDSRQVEAQLEEPALHRMIVVFEQNALMPRRDADKRRLEKSQHIVVECGQVNVVARRAKVVNFELRRNLGARATKPEQAAIIADRFKTAAMLRSRLKVLAGQRVRGIAVSASRIGHPVI